MLYLFLAVYIATMVLSFRLGYILYQSGVKAGNRLLKLVSYAFFAYIAVLIIDAAVNYAVQIGAISGFSGLSYISVIGTFFIFIFLNASLRTRWKKQIKPASDEERSEMEQKNRAA